jgi:hypothetical protein
MNKSTNFTYNTKITSNNINGKSSCINSSNSKGKTTSNSTNIRDINSIITLSGLSIENLRERKSFTNFTNCEKFEKSEKNENSNDYEPIYEPLNLPPEWNEEEARNFDFGIYSVNSNYTNFRDPDLDKIELPNSFPKVTWLRPEEYIRNYLLDKEIASRFPHKNPKKFRKLIKEIYHRDKIIFVKMSEKFDIEINSNHSPENLRGKNYLQFNEDEKSFFLSKNNKKNYKDFYNILEKKINVKVVEVFERQENDEEFFERKVNEMESNNNMINTRNTSTGSRNLRVAEKNEKTVAEKNDDSTDLPDFSDRISSPGTRNKIANTKKSQTHIYNKNFAEILKKEIDTKALHNISNNTSNVNKSFHHKKSMSVHIDNYQRLKIKEIDPSNIRINSEESKYLTYSKWVAGIFQSIKDLEILDVNTNETIWDKIYPKENSQLKKNSSQKNSHFPIYNPSGRYWIKLYFWGKHRKIEIDDYMPCNRDEELLLPRCENIQEIWPALLTKALIKLYSPFLNVNVNEDSTIGDCSIIYSLTGYIGEKILLKQYPLDKGTRNYFKKILQDEEFKNKKKFLLSFKYDKEEEKRGERNSKTYRNKNKNNLDLSLMSEGNINIDVDIDDVRSKKRHKTSSFMRRDKKLLSNSNNNFTRNPNKHSTVFTPKNLISGSPRANPYEILNDKSSNPSENNFHDENEKNFKNEKILKNEKNLKNNFHDENLFHSKYLQDIIIIYPLQIHHLTRSNKRKKTPSMIKYFLILSTQSSTYSTLNSSI